MRNYGIPEKIVNLTRKMYGRTVSKVIHEGQLSESFEVKTGVRQDFLLSPFLIYLLSNETSLLVLKKWGQR